MIALAPLQYSYCETESCADVESFVRKRESGLLMAINSKLLAAQTAILFLVIALIQVLFFAWLGLMPLDAVRFQWSQMPVWLQVSGAFILLCSFYLFFLTFRENPYLSPAVRIQKERGHTVITTGPYRHVRHPMYAAFILFVLGTSLLLGSWYGVLAGLIQVVIIARRAVLEERMLRK